MNKKLIVLMLVITGIILSSCNFNLTRLTQGTVESNSTGTALAEERTKPPNLDSTASPNSSTATAQVTETAVATMTLITYLLVGDCDHDKPEFPSGLLQLKH